MIPLNYALILSALLLSIGIYGVVAKRSAVMVLMAIELMLNAVNINFVAFSAYRVPYNPAGQIFAVFTIAVGAAEIGVGLALLLALYKTYKTVEVQDIKELKW